MFNTARASSSRGRASRPAILASVATGVAILSLVLATSQTTARTVPVLAGPWAPGQEGYGHVKPRRIFNGGDPTGLVKNIQWLSWGGREAIGTGTALWVGPKQAVAQGHFESGVRIVLFQLGRCHGRAAYDAIDWYFPNHGQRFSSRTYINACSGKYYISGHAQI